MVTNILHPQFPVRESSGFPLFKIVSGDVLDTNARTKLLGSARVRRYTAGATLVSPGETAPFVGCVMNGVLRLVRRTAEGQEQIVGLMTATDLFGHRFSQDSAFALEAATDVSICQFERLSFETLVSDSRELEQYLLMGLIDDRSLVREWLALINSTKTLQRLALFLTMLARPHQEAHDGYNELIEVNVPISRGDLAHFLFTTPETISRSLRNLHGIGAIRIISASCFQLLDTDKLKKMAGPEEIPDGPHFRRLSQVFTADVRPV